MLLILNREAPFRFNVSKATTLENIPVSLYRYLNDLFRKTQIDGLISIFYIIVQGLYNPIGLCLSSFRPAAVCLYVCTYVHTSCTMHASKQHMQATCRYVCRCVYTL